MGIRKPLIAISILVLLAGLVSALGRQFSPGGTEAFNLGVDFQGGSVLTVKFKNNEDGTPGKPSTDDLRAALRKENLNESVIQDSIDKTDEVLIKIPLIEGEIDQTKSKSAGEAEPKNPGELNAEESQKTEDGNSNSSTNANSAANNNTGNAANSAGNTESNKSEEKSTESNSLNQVSEGREKVRAALLTFGAEAPAGTALADAEDAKFKIVGTDSVGPVAGEQLRTQAIVATLLGMVGILLFIAFRYDWTYAAGAVIAVFHDVLVTLAFFTMFQWEVSLTVLAALLTLVGFSVNDSIVIFDRIRENLIRRRGQSLYDLTNDSINQTMSRTIVTNGLVFLAVLALVLFGGEVLRGFSLALFVGAITGTYSTIAIASPIAIWWQSKIGQAKMKKQAIDNTEKKLASAARSSVVRRPVSK